MALSSLFARRPAALDTATWTPDGTTVVQRYRGAGGEREGTIVLVYTADGDRGSSTFAAACLGCTFRVARNRHGSARLSEPEAADLANTHAAGCRALDRGIPTAPDDDQAAKIVRDRLRSLREYGTTSPRYITLSDFHADRVDRQRPADYQGDHAPAHAVGARLPDRPALLQRHGHPVPAPAAPAPELTRCVPELPCCSRPLCPSRSRRPPSPLRPAPGR